MGGNRGKIFIWNSLLSLWDDVFQRFGDVKTSALRADLISGNCQTPFGAKSDKPGRRAKLETSSFFFFGLKKKKKVLILK